MQPQTQTAAASLTLECVFPEGSAPRRRQRGTEWEDRQVPNPFHQATGIGTEKHSMQATLLSTASTDQLANQDLVLRIGQGQ